MTKEVNGKIPSRGEREHDSKSRLLSRCPHTCSDMLSPLLLLVSQASANVTAQGCIRSITSLVL